MKYKTLLAASFILFFFGINVSYSKSLCREFNFITKDKILNLFLKNNYNPDELCSFDTPLIHKAIEETRFASIQKENILILIGLLKSGANLEAKDGDGHTALSFAIKNNNKVAVGLLLLYGANPNALVEQDNQSILHFVIKSGVIFHKHLFKSLLVAGADIEIKDKRGMTPLLFAVARGNSSAVFNLLKHGADIHAQDNKGNTALKIVKIMLKKNPNTQYRSIEKILLKYKQKNNAANKQ